jgi:hypothetical protein
MLNNVKSSRFRAKTPIIEQLSKLFKLLKNESNPFPKLETTRYKESYNYMELKQGCILFSLFNVIAN